MNMKMDQETDDEDWSQKHAQKVLKHLRIDYYPIIMIIVIMLIIMRTGMIMITSMMRTAIIMIMSIKRTGMIMITSMMRTTIIMTMITVVHLPSSLAKMSQCQVAQKPWLSLSSFSLS